MLRTFSLTCSSFPVHQRASARTDGADLQPACIPDLNLQLSSPNSLLFTAPVLVFIPASLDLLDPRRHEGRPAYCSQLALQCLICLLGPILSQQELLFCFVFAEFVKQMLYPTEPPGSCRGHGPSIKNLHSENFP